MQCDLDIPKISGLEDNQLTVGREFYLNCKGDWPKDLKTDSLSFVGDANMKYVLKVQGFEFRSPTEADIKVTSYIAGKVRVPQLVITDGSQKVELGQVAFEVTSVLPTPAPNGVATGEQAPAKPEPFGPFGPAVIPIPILYWFFLLAILFLSVGLVALRIWRMNQRRAMLLRLKEHDVALSPLLEFHQSMRKLQRANAAFYGKEANEEELRSGTKELSRMFRVYVSRRLRVPAFEWGEGLIISEIRREHRLVHDEYAKKLRNLFSEFRKAEAANAKVSENDLKQLAEGLRKTIEGVEALMNREVSNTKRSR